jgi:hypothetical protein
MPSIANLIDLERARVIYFTLRVTRTDLVLVNQLEFYKQSKRFSEKEGVVRK